VAQDRALERRHVARREKKLSHLPLREYVDQKLRSYWSPQQISGRLKLEGAEQRMQISHETIYQFIIGAAKEGIHYEGFLRQCHRRHTYGWRGKKRFKRIRDFKRITERPAVVAERSRVGDWESDTVRGPCCNQPGIATHVERKTRYLIAVKLESRKAEAYNQATIAAFQKQPNLPIFTMTVDNGMEFSQFKDMEKALHMNVYFAMPYHSWERGQNENTNGLLRQFFPKGLDLGGVHPAEIDEVVDQINNRPRKCLGYRTPREAMDHFVALGD
jgi:IS30 family transposase